MAGTESTPHAEEWRPVVGFEGTYEVTVSGRVRSLDRMIHDSVGHVYLRRGQEIATHASDTGYWHVRLASGGKSRNYKVHRLIYEAFVGPIPDGMIIRHLNDVGTDNRLENLAVGTHADNRHDSVRNGTHHWATKTHCPKGHPYSEENTGITNGGKSRYCRTCHRESGQAYKDANRERVRAAGREYMRRYNKLKRHGAA